MNPVTILLVATGVLAAAILLGILLVPSDRARARRPQMRRRHVWSLDDDLAGAVADGLSSPARGTPRAGFGRGDGPIAPSSPARFVALDPDVEVARQAGASPTCPGQVEHDDRRAACGGAERTGDEHGGGAAAGGDGGGELLTGAEDGGSHDHGGGDHGSGSLDSGGWWGGWDSAGDDGSSDD